MSDFSPVKSGVLTPSRLIHGDGNFKRRNRKYNSRLVNLEISSSSVKRRSNPTNTTTTVCKRRAKFAFFAVAGLNLPVEVNCGTPDALTKSTTTATTSVRKESTRGPSGEVEKTRRKGRVLGFYR